VLMHHFGHTEVTGIAPPYHSDVPFTLYTPENPGLPFRTSVLIQKFAASCTYGFREFGGRSG